MRRGRVVPVDDFRSQVEVVRSGHGASETAQRETDGGDEDGDKG